MNKLFAMWNSRAKSTTWELEDWEKAESPRVVDCDNSGDDDSILYGQVSFDNADEGWARLSDMCYENENEVQTDELRNLNHGEAAFIQRMDNQIEELKAKIAEVKNTISRMETDSQRLSKETKETIEEFGSPMPQQEQQMSGLNKWIGIFDKQRKTLEDMIQNCTENQIRCEAGYVDDLDTNKKYELGKNIIHIHMSGESRVRNLKRKSVIRKMESEEVNDLINKTNEDRKKGWLSYEHYLMIMILLHKEMVRRFGENVVKTNAMLLKRYLELYQSMLRWTPEDKEVYFNEKTHGVMMITADEMVKVIDAHRRGLTHMEDIYTEGDEELPEDREWVHNEYTDLIDALKRNNGNITTLAEELKTDEGTVKYKLARALELSAILA